MNCSSVVIKVKDDMFDTVIEHIKHSDICEYHLHEGNQIIVTIEAETTEKEVASVKEIQEIAGVISAEMVFSYCEDNVSLLQDNLEIQGDVPDVLNDESIMAEKINYHGDLKKKM